MFNEIVKSFKLNSDRLALVSGSSEYSYKQLATETFRKRDVFVSAGISNTHVVVLIGDFSFDGLTSLLALFMCKSAVIPLTRQAYEKLASHIETLEYDFLVDDNGLLNKSQKLGVRKLSPDDWRLVLSKKAASLIVFTSGSTGSPKAIAHDLDDLCYRYLTPKPPISSICFLLFDHMGGINTILFLLFRGGLAVNLEDRNMNTICKLIEKYKVELLPATPSFLSQLLISKAYFSYDLSSLRVISYGTEIMSQAVLEKLNRVFPGCTIKQTYGLSETGVFDIKSKANDSLWFRFNDKGVNYKVEQGILWVKTKSNLLGKISFDSGKCILEKTEAEWYCTNDLVEESEGFLKILGRNSDLINVGGVKVYPGEVENCLLELDFIEDALVKAKKNALTGQIVVAYIKLNKSIDPTEALNKIKRHCRLSLDNYKRPVQYIFDWEVSVNDRFKKVRI